MPILKYGKGIEHRDDLAKLARGIVAELGVAAGDYSETILQNKNVQKLFSIDRWANDTKRHTDSEYVDVLKRFEKYKERSIVVRKSFEQAQPMFKPIFDFIYIDGYDHTGQENGETLNQWWPLLKSGGIFAGHDYHPRWQPTIEAVNRFADRMEKDVYITKENNRHLHIYPSWYMFKI